MFSDPEPIPVSDLVVGGVQQRVQVLQRRRGLVLESGQQAALDGSELDGLLRQQILVALGFDAQLAHERTELGQRFRQSPYSSRGKRHGPTWK